MQDQKFLNVESADTAIVHSFGLHLVPEEVFSHLKLLCILNGFENLLEAGNRSKKQKTLLEKMMHQFSENPISVMEKFYRNVYFPDLPPEKAVLQTPDVPLLLQDLKNMIYRPFHAKLLEKIPSVLILHGKKDRIISWRHAQNLHLRIHGSRLFLFENAGHSLPFSHAKECWEIIEKFR